LAYSLAADLLVLLHLAFIVFVVLGGLLVWRWWRVVFVHLPAVIWAVLLEFYGWLCPLTPWEQQLRQAAGENGYSGSFIAHYLLPLIYPAGLTHNVQLLMGLGVLLINLLIYGWLLWRRRPMLK
jgi:drug/metabolite transporter superfamily protein YnfA